MFYFLHEWNQSFWRKSHNCVFLYMYFLYYFVVCSFVRKSAKLSSLYSWKISFPYLLSVEASALITKRLWYNFLLEVRKLWWWFKPQIYMFLNEWSDINNSIRLIGKAYGYWLRMFFVCNHRFTFDFQLWNEFEVKDFHSSYDIAWNW